MLRSTGSPARPLCNTVLIILRTCFLHRAIALCFGQRPHRLGLCAIRCSLFFAPAPLFVAPTRVRRPRLPLRLGIARGVSHLGALAIRCSLFIAPAPLYSNPVVNDKSDLRGRRLPHTSAGLLNGAPFSSRQQGFGALVSHCDSGRSVAWLLFFIGAIHLRSIRTPS